MADKKEREPSEYDLTSFELKALEDAITRAMQEAKGGPLSKYLAGRRTIREKRKAKVQKIKAKKGRTTIPGGMLRFIGAERSALWYDRFFGSPAEQRRAEKKIVDAEKKDKKKAGVETRREISYQSGTLVALTRQVSMIGDAVLDIAVDVADIKSIISPRDIMAKGRKGSESEGQLQAVRFNPMAPAGEQFRQVSEKGNTTGARMGADFKTSAVMQAAVAASKLVRKEEEREKRKGELREKYKFQDIDEQDVFATDPVSALREEMNKNFLRVFKILDDQEKKHSRGILAGIFDMFKKWNFMPFLSVLGKIGAVGLAAWLGYELGSWLNDKFKISQKIVDAVFAMQDWWSELDIKGTLSNFAEDMQRKVIQWGHDLGERIMSFLPDWLPGVKDWKAERAALREREISGEVPMKAPSIEQRAPVAVTELERTRQALIDRQSQIDSPEGKAAIQSAIDSYSRKIEEQDGSLYQERLKKLGDLIASKESGGNYNAYNKGTVGNKMIGADKPINLGNISIAEYLRRSQLPIDDPNRLFAVGKYQIIPDTMRGAVRHLGLNPENTKLDAATQEKIFEEYLIGHKRKKVDDFLRGKNDDMNSAMMELSKEWASIGVPQDTQRELRDKDGKVTGYRQLKAGDSYYAGVGGNRAHVTPEQIASILRPASVTSGASLDGNSRAVSAAQARPSAESIAMLQPVAMHSTQPIMTPAGRPMQRASAFNRDGSYLLTASRDAWHPAG